MMPARAKDAFWPHRHFLCPTLQVWALSGASMPNRWMPLAGDHVVSPSITWGLPLIAFAGAGGKRNAKAKMPNHRLITGTVCPERLEKKSPARGGA